jgi:hypothetical protein
MRRGRFHGLRFQRRVKLFPGVHLNLSLSGVGVSAGGRGFHVGVTARGQKYVSAGLPGTGLSVRQYAPAARIGSGSSTPRMSLWPLVMAAVMLGLLLLVAAMR